MLTTKAINELLALRIELNTKLKTKGNGMLYTEREQLGQLIYYTEQLVAYSGGAHLLQ